MPQKPLKIGYLMQADSVQMSKVSGPQLHVKAVVRGFQQRGHKVRTMAIQQGKIQWSDDLVQWQLAAFGYSRSRLFLALESVLRRIQSQLKLPFFRFFDSYHYSDACVTALSGFDILYERFGILSFGGLIAAKRLDIPIILELNGDLLEEYVQLGINLSKAQWMVLRFVTQLMYKQADRLVTVTETLAQTTSQRWHLDPAKIIAVPNGAEVKKFVHPNKNGDMRSRYSLGAGPNIILVSSFYPWHGIDLLIEAFADLVSTHPTATLVLVGDGVLRQTMQEKVAALQLTGRVVFTGMIDHAEVPSLLNVADIAVTYHKGSKAETALSPLKLFEYMAAGKAIVAPAVPNIEKILSHQVTGFLIPPDNPAELAQALDRLLKDHQLRSTMGKAAQQQAIEKHSWSSTVRKLETIINSVLKERHKQLCVESPAN